MRARSRSADKRPEAGTPRGPCGGAAGSGMGAHAHDGTFLAVRRNYSAGDSGKHHAERERPRAEATRPGRPPAPSSRAGPETASAFRSAAMAGRGVGGTASGRSVPGRRGVSELGRVGARHCGRPRATARFRATWRILRRATGPFTEKAECGERATSQRSGPFRLMKRSASGTEDPGKGCGTRHREVKRPALGHTGLPGAMRGACHLPGQGAPSGSLTPRGARPPPCPRRPGRTQV